MGILGGGLIKVLSRSIIGLYNITPETAQIAGELMDAIAFIVIFQSMNSILTKGVLRGGGDTKFLMVADIIFLWAASLPLEERKVDKNFFKGENESCKVN